MVSEGQDIDRQTSVPVGVELTNTHDNDDKSKEQAPGTSVSPEDDPAFYNTWRKIVSQPPTKPKMKALTRELLSGLTVSLAQIPEAVAFSFTAGVDPLIGLQAAWIVGLTDAIGGGAPGMVSGATGALAVVLPEFVEEYGYGYLFIAVLLMGILQFIFGLVGGGRLIKLIGHPVMVGFCNGLAIVIFAAQFHSFKYVYYCPSNCDSVTRATLGGNNCTTTLGETNVVKCEEWITGAVAGFQALEVVATMSVVFWLPKLTKAFPSSLAGIIVATIIEWAIVRTSGYETPTVQDLGSIQGTFPIPIWLDSNYKNTIPSLAEWETYQICLPISVTLAVIGLVESLMTMQLVGQITERAPNARRESLAQGTANVITGIFGGMGGCAMIGQSMINVKSGGVTRISTAFAASFLLVIILVAYPAINLIPVASLAGVMFMVCYFTFEWSSLAIIFACCLPEQWREKPRLRWIKKVKRWDAANIVMVTVVAATTNLAIAVGAGIVLSALIFSWDQEKFLEASRVEEYMPAVAAGESGSVSKTRGPSPDQDAQTNGGAAVADTDPTDSLSPSAEGSSGADPKPEPIETMLSSLGKGIPEGITDPGQVAIYQIRGPIFFASAQKFLNLFNPHTDPEHVVLYLDQAVLSDYSALVALNQLAEKYSNLNKQLHLRKASPHSMKAIRKAHHLLFTYDKQSTEEVLEEELLSMELSPNWQVRMPHYQVNKYSVDETSTVQDGTDAATEDHGVKVDLS